jgi:aminopeptidase-like protein
MSSLIGEFETPDNQEKTHQFTSSVNYPMHQWATDLFPICRSITGSGVRESLAYLSQLIPDLLIREISSGTKVFDWEVPDEWNILSAYIEDENGNRIVDFKNNNLHVIGYCEPIDEWVDLETLNAHLYSRSDMPEAIPYVTSYYERRWGFCMSHNQRQELKPGKYHVFVDSTLKPGVLNYGEIILPGSSTEEVFLSTYICHPSMANNELSGPVVTTALVKWLMSLPERRLTYRIVFIPERIGSLVYLSRHLEEMKKNIIAGFNISCVGDERAYSYLESRKGDTLADRVAIHTLGHHTSEFGRYSFLQRGSDEIQYCAPGIDLPVATIMRSRFGSYPEYHTSFDDLTKVVTQEGLEGGLGVLQKCLLALEVNRIWKMTVLCEPQLGKRGLYSNLGLSGFGASDRSLTNVIAYLDGKVDLLTVADIIGISILKCAEIVEILVQEGLAEEVVYD